MSAVTSTGSSGLYQFFQGISSSGGASASTPTVSVEGASATASTDGSGSSVQGTPHHHGGKGGGGGFAKLQAAVTSALQDAKANGTDPNTAIEDAIKSVFSQKPDGGTPPAGAPPTSDGSDPAASGSTGSTDSASASKQAFLQTLQSFGVSEDQFRSDFAAAAQSAQSGQATDGSSAFQSFPSGSALDVAA